jgi:hypothetical protein
LIKKLVEDLVADAEKQAESFGAKLDLAAGGGGEKIKRAAYIKHEFDKLGQKSKVANHLTYKQIAQEVEDWYGPAAFAEKVAAATRIDPNKELNSEMKLRLSYLSRIPFRAIITTNYNNLLDGDSEIPTFDSKGARLRSNSTYPMREGNLNPDHNFEEILRPKVRGGGRDNGGVRYGSDDLLQQIEERNQDARQAEVLSKPVMTVRYAGFTFLTESPSDCCLRDGWALLRHIPILKVHGCVTDPSSIVLSQSGYKKLLHETASYKTFLTSLMATSTILYLGFSFGDEYLNEFRSEVLSMLRPCPVPQLSATDELLAKLKGTAECSSFFNLVLV